MAKSTRKSILNQSNRSQSLIADETGASFLDVDQLQSLRDDFETVARCGQIKGARIDLPQGQGHGQTILVESTWSTPNSRLGKRVIRKRISVLDVSQDGKPPNVVADTTSSMLGIACPSEFFSTSGRYLCHLIKSGEGKDAKQLISIFDRKADVESMCVDVTAAKKHADILVNDQTGGIQWSNGEGHILYVANKLHEPKDWFELDLNDLEEEKRTEKLNNYGTKYEEVQSWGEQLSAVTRPTLCIMDVTTGTVTTIDNLPDNVDPFEPQWSKDDSKIYFVGVHTDSAHGGRLGMRFCLNRPATLYSYDVKTAQHETETKSNRVVLDLVAAPKLPNEFPGLYVSYLPFARRCFSEDSQRMLISSTWGSFQQWGSASDSCPLGDERGLLAGCKWDIPVLRRPPQEDESGNVDIEFEAVLLLPDTKFGVNLPLVVLPHGGPHGNTPAAFRPLSAFLAARGYASLAVNYRGSVGFGENCVDSIPGNCGTLDIRDCHYAVQTALDANPVLDRKRVFVCGGSHGGFVCAHLAGQYPDFYRGFSLLNPVLDFGGMASITDIPDWCVVEALGRQYDPKQFLSPSDTEKMLQKSPIFHAHKVRAPVMLNVGDKDLRVVPHYARFRDVLRANGVRCVVRRYPESDHALVQVDAETDFMLGTVRFFDTINSE